MRLATPADEAALLALYGACFGKAFSPEWWRWYAQCPHRPQLTCIAEEAGKLVAAYSLLALDLRVGPETVPASLCNNVCVHPEWQRRGLFVALGHYALEQDRARGRVVALGMPNAQALPGHLRVGWREVVPLSRFVRLRPTPRLHRCFWVTRFDPGLADCGPAHGVRVVHDLDWLTWRLRRRPERYYTILATERRGTLGGYVALKHYDDHGLRKVHICDLAAVDSEAVLDLLAGAEDFAVGRDRLDCWTNPRAPWRREFIEAGFEEEPSADRLIAYGDLDDGQAPVSFTYSDNDVH